MFAEPTSSRQETSSSLPTHQTMAGRPSISLLNCALLLASLCLFCEVTECEQDTRRHDVHRIVLKGKSRNRNKKPPPPRPLMDQDYRHAVTRDAFFENPYGPHFDQVGDHSNNQYVRYHNRHRDQIRDYDRPKAGEDARYQSFDDYKTRQKVMEQYADRQPHLAEAGTHSGRPKYNLMNVEDFNTQEDRYADGSYGGAFRETYGDYERYKQLMDEYNDRNEEKFRAKVEKSKLQHHQQQFSPYVEDGLSAVETHNFPVAWQTPNLDSFKGAWSPVSSVPLVAGTKPSMNKINDLYHPAIEDFIELTTSKSFALPPTIVEADLTNGLTKQTTTSFDFYASEGGQHLNHKYPKNKPGTQRMKQHGPKGSKGGTYQVHEDTADVVASASHESFQDPASETDSSYVVLRKPAHQEPSIASNQAVFGLKMRRTKRPAGASK